MSFYVSAISNVVEHIENNIGESLQLDYLASLVGLSDFHFNRLFKTAAGITLKQYILGRKLTKALEQLKSTKKSILEIALESGFEYPEVFSRAFKRQFGISPAYYREYRPSVSGVAKAYIVERDIINYRGILSIKGSSIWMEPLLLKGVFTGANTYAPDFKQRLKLSTEDFIAKSAQSALFDQEKFYTAVSCTGNDDGDYTVFCGRKAALNHPDLSQWSDLAVNGGWYASFLYHGDMFDIREVFIDDLYRWIMVKEAEISLNGIGMLNTYEQNYPQDNAVQILIPIKKPV